MPIMPAGRKLRLKEIIPVNDKFVQAMLKGRMSAVENVIWEKLKMDSSKLFLLSSNLRKRT